jgi:hypothetical protein
MTVYILTWRVPDKRDSDFSFIQRMTFTSYQNAHEKYRELLHLPPSQAFVPDNVDDAIKKYVIKTQKDLVDMLKELQ